MELFGIFELIQGMVIGDKNIILILILQINELLHGAEIIADVHAIGRLDARE
jgi:hypothetical protein